MDPLMTCSIYVRDGYIYFVFSDEEEAEMAEHYMRKLGCKWACYGGYYNAWYKPLT